MMVGLLQRNSRAEAQDLRGGERHIRPMFHKVQILKEQITKDCVYLLPEVQWGLLEVEQG